MERLEQETQLTYPEICTEGSGRELIDEIRSSFTEEELACKEISMDESDTQWTVITQVIEQGDKDLTGIITRYFPNMQLLYIPIMSGEEQTGTLMIEPSTKHLVWAQKKRGE